MSNMKEKIKSIIILFVQFAKVNRKFLWKITFAIVAIVSCVFLIMMLVSRNGNNAGEITIEDTAIEIAEVMPKGEIVVCSAIIEDYTTQKKTERTFGILKKEHTCVQILKMKCSFKIDLDKVEYTTNDTSNVVWVKLPELEYVDNLQASPFMSDDEVYWKENMPSTNKMKSKVRSQIKKRFDTPSNRRKGERFAEDAISNMLEKMGYEAEFVRTIERNVE